jgi:uncharacterized membrane protein YfcA
MAVSPEFVLLVAVGFLAELVDGCFVMGYEICSGALLMGLGIPLVTTRSSVLVAEVVVRGVSSVSHAWLGNVDRKIIRSLLLPGIVGGLTGAILLDRLPVSVLRPLVWAYLFVTSLVLLFRAIVRRAPIASEPQGAQLGVIAGFLGGVGCGGWAAIITSNMIARGVMPRYSIGAATTVAFCIKLVSLGLWLPINGIRYDLAVATVIGGILAAPLAAWVARQVAPRAAATAVGILVCAVSVAGLFDTLT